MDIPTASNRQNCEFDKDKSASGHDADFDSQCFDPDKSLSEDFLSMLRSPATSSDISTEQVKTKPPAKPKPSDQMSQKKKCVHELFPWLNEIETSTHKCLGSVTEVKSKTILNAMDFLIRWVINFTFLFYAKLYIFSLNIHLMRHTVSSFLFAVSWLMIIKNIANLQGYRSFWPDIYVNFFMCSENYTRDSSW